MKRALLRNNKSTLHGLRSGLPKTYSSRLVSGWPPPPKNKDNGKVWGYRLWQDALQVVVERYSTSSLCGRAPTSLVTIPPSLVAAHQCDGAGSLVSVTAGSCQNMKIC